MWIAVISFSCWIFSGQAIDSWSDRETNAVTSLESHESERASILQNDGKRTLTANVLHASGPIESPGEHEGHQWEAHCKNGEIIRTKRGTWGRKHAATVASAAYRILGLTQPLKGWRSKTENVTSGFVSTLKDLFTEKQRLMDTGKTKVEEEEEEEEEEPTEVPGNETLSTAGPARTTDCVVAEGELSCRGLGLTQLPTISDRDITKVDMTGNRLKSITPKDFSGMRNLDSLDLSKNDLVDEALSQRPLFNLTFLKMLNLDDNLLTIIPELPVSLEMLSINNNRLSTITPHSFRGLTNLVSLEMEENLLHEGTVSPQAFRPLQNLVDLQLDNNRFRSFPLGLPSSLQELEISENLIEEMREEALRDCVHLRVLDMSHNLLNERGIAHNSWRHARSLESLDLSFNHFTSVPTALPRPLLKLSLHHNNITSIPAFTFRHLRPGLALLRLSHNALGSRGVERYSFVGTYRSLGELLLDNNSLKEVPRCVRQFKKLQVLRLDNNHIRLVNKWGVCHPRNSGTTLASVHIENNEIDLEKMPQKAFNCLTDAKGLVLHPQMGHNNINVA